MFGLSSWAVGTPTPAPPAPAASSSSRAEGSDRAVEGGYSAVQELALRVLAVAPPLSVFTRVGGSPQGLTEAEASRRFAPAGDDPLGTGPASPAVARLRAAVLSPFVVLLAGLGLVFAILGDPRGWVTVAIMVGATVGLRWWLGVRAERTLRALRSRATATVTVRRRIHPEGTGAGRRGAERAGSPRGVEREVAAEDVVRGDVLLLSPGDVVPADLRVLTARQLRVDQSVLSGELLPVAKQPPARDSGGAGRTRRRGEAGGVALMDLASVCFAGTTVVSGSATGVVLATGAGTYLDALTRVADRARPRSSVEQGVRSVGWTLVRFMLVLVPLVLAVSGVAGGDWTQAALFAVAVAVGLTPEMLPVIVTATLARGAWRLARQDVVVKRLDAIGDLAGIDVLCVDKTGTLTQDQVEFSHSIDAGGELDDAAAEFAFLIAHFGSGPPDRFGHALVEQWGAEQAAAADARYVLVEEDGFDPNRRRSSMVLGHGRGEHLRICFGDPSEVMTRCGWARRDGQVVELTAALRDQAVGCVAGHEQHGMRILAVAVSDGPARSLGPDLEPDTGLVLAGFVGFLDPVKVSTASAVTALAEHGVQAAVLTGDSPEVAARVCAQAGIPIGRIVSGAEVDAACDVTLERLVARTTVFAKVSPAHKARIVAALRRRGHSVGFLGDGVNDTAALRTADVGICVNTAAPAARAAADVVLLAENLDVLVGAVLEGRRMLANTMKYVKITAASNLGNVFSVVAASAFLPFLPMLPIQLMVQNLLYDAAQLALPWDRVDPDTARRPRRWDAARLVRFMLVFGPLSSVFDLATFGVLWWGLRLDDPTDQAVFHAAWFTEGLLSQLLVVLVLRSRALHRPPRAVLVATAAAVTVGALLPLSMLAGPLGFAPTPAGFLPWLAAILAAYLLTAHVTKTVVARRAGTWL